MVKLFYATCLLLTLCNADAQFFDFFSALQPGQQTLRPIFQFDITTKRPKPQTKTTRRYTESTTKRSTPFSFYSDQFVTVKKTKTPVTTVKSVRTTAVNRIDKGNTNKAINYNQFYNDGIANGGVNNKKATEITRNGNKGSNDDRLIFDDGKRNTIVNYGTTKSYYDDRRTRYTTQRPIRDGVIAAVAVGPPITNKPSTRRPSSGTTGNDDTSVSPELVIGPDEDYMTVVDKKRHIEIAEQMCDKYKALDVQQVEAIPLVPSPEPVAVNVSSCPNEVALILGGRVATIQEFRHMVLLGWTKLPRGGYSWKCGGSLVSAQYVLTAAHCAYQDRDNTVVTGTPRVVQLGSSRMDDPGATIRKVASVIRHPKYKLPKSYYDIALVKMANAVKFSSVIKPACMGIPPPPGKHIVATGWGKTEYSDQSLELRKVSLPIWDIAECYTALGTSRKLPEGPSADSQVCAGDRSGGRDTCQGDSGGPAQIQEGCSWRVVAVTSLGRSCGAVQTPAVYARVPRAFVSAVVFKGQVEKDDKPQWNTQSNNQQTNQQNWNNQPTRNPQNWNRNQEISTRNPQLNNQGTQNGQNSRNTNNDRGNTQSNVYYEDSRNKNNEYQTYNQNQQRNNENDNNRQINSYTTARPGYNNGRNGDYSVIQSGYQSDFGYNDRQLWT